MLTQIKLVRLENLICSDSFRITGYIEVAISGGKEGGVLFFNNGVIIGTSCSWEKKGPESKKENQELLIQKSKEFGGVFNVSRVSFEKMKEEMIPENQVPAPPSNLLPMIEELLITFEKTVRNHKKMKTEFNTLLRGKFMEKADEYEFLDPFAAEFQYANEKVKYVGNADNEQLAKAVFECVVELADELGLRQQLPKVLSQWAKTYSKEIARINLRIR
ncbi:MAG: hypothetical protein JRI75_02075 [Deltaproteobacteria bacterium]|nr:hypothetical protein [Deltaproteobacteria bacterium]